MVGEVATAFSVNWVPLHVSLFVLRLVYVEALLWICGDFAFAFAFASLTVLEQTHVEHGACGIAPC